VVLKKTMLTVFALIILGAVAASMTPGDLDDRILEKMYSVLVEPFGLMPPEE